MCGHATGTPPKCLIFGELTNFFVPATKLFARPIRYTCNCLQVEWDKQPITRSGARGLRLPVTQITGVGDSPNFTRLTRGVLTIRAECGLLIPARTSLGSQAANSDKGERS
jgi:hypothetical protein